MNESENCQFSFSFYLAGSPCANAEILGFISYKIVISWKKNYFRPQDIFRKLTILYQLFIAKYIDTSRIYQTHTENKKEILMDRIL